MDFPTNYNVSLGTSNTEHSSGNDMATHGNAGKNAHGKSFSLSNKSAHGKNFGFCGKKGEICIEEDTVRAVSEIVDFQETTSEQGDEIDLEAERISEDILKSCQVDEGDVEIDSSTDKG